ncbi:hypothetical protein PF005_g26772 [Phytophthora fragariae]|uniref:Uncharacterized protein n=1 Tax=Phytophthora fragariae TaxID=53985 RepID=A0A6A3WEB7_9STRA|nr:hypothetical protein PF009_g27450 [Phytophthora fragariae]KAE8972383.1 hypothetical protein PF011_g25658 [Phytophthora fragariae]KAE9070923.1 hypothetical protein PF007_g26750 [Phytophthora fragariae]KAE9085471.1 hypothetical protein PF006_g26250 [Phytophthora fragariae]KAE9172295.1 hypothetical protein PF005_g26772 [Phytophthora fragariae]
MEAKKAKTKEIDDLLASLKTEKQEMIIAEEQQELAVEEHRCRPQSGPAACSPIYSEASLQIGKGATPKGLAVRLLVRFLNIVSTLA